MTICPTCGHDTLPPAVYTEWCPVCHTYHENPGVKTDAGGLVERCPRIPADDPRNQFENFPLSKRDAAIIGAARNAR